MIDSTHSKRRPIRVPAGFQPDNPKHVAAIIQKASDGNPEGWSVESFDADERLLYLSWQPDMTTIKESQDATLVLSLARGTRPSDGDRIATKFEADHPGFYLTKFDPFLGRATMTKLAPDTNRARQAVAYAIGVKPWDIQVAKRRGGGYTIGLPSSYQDSKHRTKLEEVATGVVGNPGWYVTVDTMKLTAEMVPSTPPTFPASIAYPVDRVRTLDPDMQPFGVELGPNGDTPGEHVGVDWRAANSLLLAGLPGSGKSVTVNAILFGALAAGSELVIVDEPSKAIDYHWVKPYVRDGGWGCKDLEHAVTALSLVYEEGKRRAQILADKGYVNWLDMKPGERFTPLQVVVDEVTALLVTDKLPQGVPKDNPIVQETIHNNLMKVMLASLINKLIAEQRFVGVRVLLATQVTNNATGIPPSLKSKIGHRLLQGVRPSKQARDQAFNDPNAVPEVPDWIANDKKAGRGVGASSLEGRKPVVYKSYFLPASDPDPTKTTYATLLKKLGLPQSRRPEPTQAEVRKFIPQDEDMDDNPDTSRLAREGGWGERDGRDIAADDRLRGAAAAAHASTIIQEQL